MSVRIRSSVTKIEGLKMKIELKNVKHSKFASQETDCFEATVYIDGKKEGTVFNSGNGGCNSYHPWSLEEKLKEYAKTLPAMDVSYLFKDGEVHTMEHDADTLIGDLFTKHLQKKDCAKKVMFRIPNFNYSHNDEYHVIKEKYTPDVKKELVQKYGKEVFILNEQFI